MSDERGCCFVLADALERHAKEALERAFEWRNVKEIDFSYSECNPHPFPHPDSDRLEHCYKYGHGDGKFLPVLLGQQLGDYRVDAKLGHGNFATVWQAEHIDGDRPTVAIKACTNSKKDSKENVIEARTLHKLKKITDGKGDFGKNHILHIGESFKVRGHFGKHFCIVSEAIGPSLDYYFRLTDKQGLGCFDYGVAKKIVFQILSSVTWLHEAGYGHGDIHPHNILLKEEGFTAGRNERRPLCTANTKEKDLPYMPEYLVACVDDDLTCREPLRLETTDARLADFGQAFKKNHPRRKYKMTTPKGNRSPEWAFKYTAITQSIDVWAIACIAYRMVTGKHLMFVEERHPDGKGGYLKKRTKFEINQDHMPMMVDLFGPPPNYLIRRWKQSSLPEIDWDTVDPIGSLHERIQQDRPAGMSDEEAASFEEFLRMVFVWDYRYRATAKQLIQHPWLTSIMTVEDRIAMDTMLKTTDTPCCSIFKRFGTKLGFLRDRVFALGSKKIELEAASTPGDEKSVSSLALDIVIAPVCH